MTQISITICYFLKLNNLFYYNYKLLITFIVDELVEIIDSHVLQYAFIPNYGVSNNELGKLYPASYVRLLTTTKKETEIITNRLILT